MILVGINIALGLFINVFTSSVYMRFLVLELLFIIPIILYSFMSRQSIVVLIKNNKGKTVLSVAGMLTIYIIVLFLNVSQISLLMTQMLILVPGIVYVILTKQNFFKLIRMNKISIVSIILIIIFTYCILPFLSLVNAVSMLFASNVIQNTVTEIVGDNLILGVALVALIPAFVEESMYRGIFYHTYRGARPMKGILVSALLFGAMHMNFNQFTYAVVIGIIMGLLIEATDSILSTMVMHFIFNANSVVLTFVLPKIQKAVGNIFGEATAGQFAIDTALSRDEILLSIVGILPIAILGLAASFGIYLLIATVNGRLGYIKTWFNKDIRTSLDRQKIIDPYLTVSVLLCLGLAIMTEISIRL